MFFPIKEKPKTVITAAINGPIIETLFIYIIMIQNKVVRPAFTKVAPDHPMAK